MGKLKNPRRDNDYYPTDVDVVDAGLFSLWAFMREHEITAPRGNLVEPASGHMAPFAHEAFRMAPMHYGERFWTVDLLPQGLFTPARIHTEMDFFDWCQVYGRRQWAFVPTNPPYALAEEFMRATAGWLLQDYGLGFFLLRLSFLETETRVPLWQNIKGDSPVKLLLNQVLPRRPSYTGDGQTDSCAYSFFTFTRRGSKMHEVWRRQVGTDRAIQEWVKDSDHGAEPL